MLVISVRVRARAGAAADRLLEEFPSTRVPVALVKALGPGGRRLDRHPLPHELGEMRFPFPHMFVVNGQSPVSTRSMAPPPPMPPPI